MILFNGTGSNTLAGKPTGVLDNCFTVGCSGLNGGGGEERREGRNERRGWREGTSEVEIERENRERGSLEFVAQRISGCFALSLSLHPV